MHGFARTIPRVVELEDPADRYMEIIQAATVQLGELLDELSLVARIEGRRYEPTFMDRDSLQLAAVAAERLGEERVAVSGAGGSVRVDPDATERAITALARCALRHGGLERVTVEADGAEVRISPITASAAPVVVGVDLRDLGAAVAVRLVRALGGDVGLDAGTLHVRLPGP